MSKFWVWFEKYGLNLLLAGSILLAGYSYYKLPDDSILYAAGPLSNTAEGLSLTARENVVPFYETSAYSLYAETRWDTLKFLWETKSLEYEAVWSISDEVSTLDMAVANYKSNEESEDGKEEVIRKAAEPFLKRAEPGSFLKEDDSLGNSDGLMVALQYIQTVNQENLTAGKMIAGTGALDGDGKVIAVGSIRHKVKGARKAGADIFFVPEENYKDALAANKGWVGKSSLKIVKVKTLGEAMEYLHN